MESKEILQEVVTDQLEIGTQTIGEAKGGVEQRIDGIQELLREQYGESVIDASAGLHREFEHWSRGIGYDASITVDAIGEQGAAGMHNLSSHETILDHGAMDVQRDESYWERVEAHEVEGHGNQASSFNAETLAYAGGTASLTDLLEWDAITTANQPDGDLTAGYKEHKRIGEEIAGIVGRGVLKNGLQTGDLASVQDKIEIAQIKTELGLPQEAPLDIAA